MLKNAQFYGSVIALKNQVPPGTSAAAFYTSLAEVMLMMLQDAVVNPAGTPPMSNAGGPVTGFGKIQ